MRLVANANNCLVLVLTLFGISYALHVVFGDMSSINLYPNDNLFKSSVMKSKPTVLSQISIL